MPIAFFVKAFLGTRITCCYINIQTNVIERSKLMLIAFCVKLFMGTFVTLK